MIVVDSSVFVALAADEPDAKSLIAKLGAADGRVMSAGNYLECAMICEARFGGRQELDTWLREMNVTVVAVDLRLAQGAADAFARFGKGKHPAGLNYGDCFAYALAKSLGAPLLYKGQDFTRTDLARA